MKKWSIVNDKWSMKRWSMIYTLLLLLPIGIFAQNSVKFSAQADARQVVLNGYFTITYTIGGGDANTFSAPTFKNFAVVSGPNRSTSMSIINGHTTRESSMSYTLQAKKTGRFSLPAATIRFNGKTIRSNKVSIEVVKGREGLSNDNKIFVKAVVNTTEARIGQQLILDYKLYTTVSVNNYNFTAEPEYSGFYVQELTNFSSRAVKEVLEGVQYTTQILQRVILYPQQSGTIEIPAAFFKLGVVDNTRPRTFFGQPTKAMLTQTDAIPIHVLPLPGNAPFSFSGAVGKFKMSSMLKRNTFTTDDAISLKMVIDGDGDAKRTLPPDLGLPADKFEAYPARVINENAYGENGSMRHTKEIEYLFVPKIPGKYTIQAEFTYFDTDSLAFITLKPNRFPIIIRKGSQTNNPLADFSDNTANTDIRFIKTDAVLRKKGTPFFGSLLFWILSILPFLAVGSVVYLKRQQIAAGNLDITLVKRNRAAKVAQKRLVEAKKYLDDTNSKAFYDEISRALFGYICDKLSIPLSELTKENVVEKLDILKIDASQTEQFIQIIQTCEMALFAGKDNAQSMNETYHGAVNILTKMEEKLGS